MTNVMSGGSSEPGRHCDPGKENAEGRSPTPRDPSAPSTTTRNFIAGLSQKNQDVFWFSDEDEIAANPQRLTLLTKMWANVISNYPVHSLRHLKCGTTRSDDGSNEIEDFAAIPDLVAGALSDLLTSIAGQFRLGLIVPFRLDSKAKATMIGQWLS